jgi:hypothetical protein
MRAEFWVKHSDIREDELRDRLRRVFGEDDRSAIDSSEVFTAEWRDSVLFAREDPSYRLICFKSTDIELQMHVEPINANIFRASESAWQGIKKVFKEKNPQLTDLRLVDPQSHRDFLSARTGLRTELRRREVVSPLTVAVSVAIYSVIAVLTFAENDAGRFLLGAVSGVIPGIVAIVLACLEAHRGVLRWG